MKRVYRKFKEERAKQMEERRQFNRIQLDCRYANDENENLSIKSSFSSSTSLSPSPPSSSPPPYSSAPTLAEIEKHESEQNLSIPLRSSSISSSTKMYPTLSHNDITAPSYEISNRPLRHSQIYNTGEQISYHEYILPPFECKRPRRPTTISIEKEIPKPTDISNPNPKTKTNFVIIKKSQKELIRPSWFNRIILQQPTLQITKTVELKVAEDRKFEFQKFSYYQLKKFKGAQESDHVSIFNPKSCKIG